MNDDGQVIRATFSETEDYLIEAAKRSPERARLARKTAFVGVTAAAIASVFVAWAESRKPDGTWWLGIPIGAFAAGFLIYQNTLSGMRRRIRAEARKRNGTVPQNSMEFRTEGFTTTALNGKSSFHPWPSVPKAVVYADGLMIYFSERAFTWLPRTSFASDRDYLALQERIATKVRSVERMED